MNLANLLCRTQECLEGIVLMTSLIDAFVSPSETFRGLSRFQLRRAIGGGKVNRIAGRLATSLAVFAVFAVAPPVALGGPITTEEVSNYLVVGTGESSQGDEFPSFQMSNTEIGANQEVLPTCPF